MCWIVFAKSVNSSYTTTSIELREMVKGWVYNWVKSGLHKLRTRLIKAVLYKFVK